jgi:hypothetical protein
VFLRKRKKSTGVEGVEAIEFSIRKATVTKQGKIGCIIDFLPG